MNPCCNLYLLSTIACQLREYLSDDELAILSADLMTLGDMLASILARQAACHDDGISSDTDKNETVTHPSK